MRIRVLGLIPYVVHYLRTESLIAYVVFSNGLLYHVAAPENVLIKWYDILCNTCMVIYVNMYVMNIYVFLWSCVAGGCFIWNSRYIKHKPLKAFFTSWVFGYPCTELYSCRTFNLKSLSNPSRRIFPFSTRSLMVIPNSS